MSAAKRVAHAAETIRARWERRTVESPQMEAAQALEDAGLLAVAAHEVGAQAPSADPRIELIRKERTHCEVTRFESEDDRLPHVWGPSSYPKREMCQRCTVSREWAEDPEAADVVLLAEVDRLSAQVAELLAEWHSTNEALSDAAERLRADRDRIAELEALAAAATEYRVWEPGYGLYVRRSPGAEGFAILEARRTAQGRRAWTTAGLRYTVVLSDAELYCWPDAESAVAEARRVLPGAVVREDEPAETGGAQ